MTGNKGKLFVVSGPSGSGKSTLCTMLAEQTGIALSVSATTRPKGVGEIDGQHYYFLSHAAFEEKIQQGAFLEYAQVFGNYYGTPMDPVQQKLHEGRPVLLEIDVQGAAEVFKQFDDACGILILPPDDQTLRQRLDRRGRDTAEIIAKRLDKAKQEIQAARNSGRYTYEIVNDNLPAALEQLRSAIAHETQIHNTNKR